MSQGPAARPKGAGSPPDQEHAPDVLDDKDVYICLVERSFSDQRGLATALLEGGAKPQSLPPSVANPPGAGSSHAQAVA